MHKKIFSIFLLYIYTLRRFANSTLDKQVATLCCTLINKSLISIVGH